MKRLRFQKQRVGGTLCIIAVAVVFILEFPVFDCELNKGFDVNMHHHMQNSALY
jgi:hypothetical protein